MSILVEEKEGWLVSEYRAPRNQHQKLDNSIHNDDVAKPLGFRGGTVAGIIHHEQFAPVMLEVFGERWFEHGSLSLYYTWATTDSEPVRIWIEKPKGNANEQLAVWMEHENGNKVLEGTVSVGAVDPAQSALAQKFAARPQGGENRILANIPVGEAHTEIRRVTPKEQAGRREVITEDSSWYWEESPWGGPICTPVTMFRVLDASQHLADKLPPKVVGLYGAIEIRVDGGPLYVDKDYEVTAKVLAVGETPKTEVMWREATLRDPDTNKDIASLLMQNRWMKGSSELWKD